jgi:hypothetical protein
MMKYTLIVMDPSLDFLQPAIKTLASMLNPTRFMWIGENVSENEKPTRLVLCATSVNGRLMVEWIQRHTSMIRGCGVVGLVEIGEESTPDSWLLDERILWIEDLHLLLSDRMAVDDIHAAADFALALSSGGHNTGSGLVTI